MKTLVGIPALDYVSTSFMQCLVALEPVDDVEMCVMQSSLVYDARNEIAKSAIDGGYDRILWLDSDMTFPPDLMARLSERLDEGYEYVSGLYFTRKEPIKPVLFHHLDMTEVDGKPMPVAKNIPDYPRNSVFQIAASGFGCVMMDVGLLKRIKDTFGLPFSPVAGFGEDLSFCIRADKVGAKMYCDSSIKLGHCGHTVITESVWEKSREEHEDGR